MKKIYVTLLFSILMLFCVFISFAQDKTYTHVSENEVYKQFDFWIGEWLAYDYESNEFIGIDDVSKDFQDCVILQNWTQINDRFKIPNAPFRLKGMSINTVQSDGRWIQHWVDNMGTSIVVKGELIEGVMTLESDDYKTFTRDGKETTVRYKWHWKPIEDGNVESWGLTKIGDGDWNKSWHLLYKPNR